MAPTKNLTLVFKEVPTGLPVPGKHIAVEDQPIDLDAELPKDTVLLEHLYHSVDPYMRGRLRDPKIKSYSPPFTLGAPLNGGAIAKVLKSNTSEFSEGDVVQGGLPFQQYSTYSLDRANNPNALPEIRKLTNPYNLTDLRLFLGPLGMPGLTAYSSFYDIGQPKKGETIFISSAAGAVGQLVGQLAKHEGLTVIGSVGSDEKLQYITEELGFDSGFNYKKVNESDYTSTLQRLAPNGIDIYYENVGGPQLSAALNTLNTFGRVVVCGMISNYNTAPSEQYGVKNLMSVVSKRLTIRGFIVGDENMGPRYLKDHQEKVGKWLKDGTFKARIDELEKVDRADEALVGMLQGRNFGKAVVGMKG